MVLLLSIESDSSTHNVIDLLNYYNADWKVIYFEELVSKKDLLSYYLYFKKANVVWFRKWGTEGLSEEQQQIVTYLFNVANNAYWVNSPLNQEVNKIIQLEIAKKLG